MRIELPLPSWADTAPRGDDDAHTLTVAPSPATEWVRWQWMEEPAATQRVQVEAAAMVMMTLTL